MVNKPDKKYENPDNPTSYVSTPLIWLIWSPCVNMDHFQRAETLADTLTFAIGRILLLVVTVYRIKPPFRIGRESAQRNGILSVDGFSWWAGFCSGRY